MTINEIFNLAIQMGTAADFRGKEGVEKFLKRKKKRYEKMDEKAKQDFDQEALKNPYLDTRILNVADDRDVKKILVGIDIEPAEILLAKELSNIDPHTKRGQGAEGAKIGEASPRYGVGVDLIVSHHPLGKGLANLADVMELQCDILNQYGVPINIAEGLMKERISEVARGVNAANHQRTVDASCLLGFNLICLHTPCDNLAANFLEGKIDKAQPERIEDLMNLFREVPEYKAATKIGAGPKIFVGSEENHCGKIVLTEMTGGTEGSPKLYEKMAQAGIGTIVGMHISEKHKKEAEAANLNVVIPGHISSDSLGVNLFLDELEKKGIETIPCSGLIRISRLK